MFKKRPSVLKTSSPLKSSDRRKLRNAIAVQFALDDVLADELVPNPILSLAFRSHLDEPGVIYLADGDPRWLRLDKSDIYIPSIYTLHKHPSLLPAVWTNSGVVPILLNGADLMIPGVVYYPSGMQERQLVSILRYSSDPNSGGPIVSVPIAVGEAAFASEQLHGQEKGKAVYILHTWKDALWAMGHAPDGDVSCQPVTSLEQASATSTSGTPPGDVDVSSSDPSPSAAPDAPEFRKPTPEETSQLLQISLFRAISTRLGNEAPSTFPIPASTFLSSYIFPCRPVRPSSLVNSDDSLPIDPSQIHVKNSTFKSLTTFLRACEKDNLLSLKQPQKHSNQTELLVTSVNRSHPSVLGAEEFSTIADVEAKAAKQNERKNKEVQQASVVEVIELYKPHNKSLAFFEKSSGNVSSKYNESQVKQFLNNYIAGQKLVDPQQQQFILPDELLFTFLPTEEKLRFKREEVLSALLSEMQGWHEIHAPGKDVVRSKGALQPIQLTVKTKQGKKVVTTIAGFEPFLVVSSQVLAEDLRKLCAGSTSVGTLPGKSGATEVSVQGQQTKAISSYFLSKGIAQKWITVTGSKKGK